MNAFYYSPQHVGLQQFPPGYFKLAGFEVAHSHADADCFVLPTDIRHVTDEQILALRYLKGNEARHVFFSLSEYPMRALPVDAIAFRTDFNVQLKRVNTRTSTQAWGVDDLAEYVAMPTSPLPADGFQYDVHAQMWASTPMTDIAVESCLRAGLKVHDQRNPFFYGTLETNQDPRLGELRATFLRTMSRSRLVLVPRSRAGVNRYRFYEAMSMGRVPVLLCDECILPCADRINWERCALFIQESDAERTGDILKEWLRQTTGHTLIKMGLYGREMWKRWLASAKWEQVWGELTRERLEGPQ